jgi:23S rRNA G2445 N2-methylase RlmL
MKFFLHTQIGIENITELELYDKFKGKYSLDYTGYVPHKNGVVQIDWREEENLDFYEKLSTVEDAYFVLGYVSNITQNNGLKDIFKAMDVDSMRKNLDYYFDKINKSDNKKNFRFVTRKKAGNDFRRVDLENMVIDFCKKNLRRVTVTQEEGDKEIWTTLVKNRLIVAVRLTTKEKRHGYYKKATVNGSLRPTVAAAMAYIAEIKSKEVLWDPFCGAGTIGCEVSENYNFKKFICSDISPDALEATKTNFDNLRSYKKNKGKISFRHEDFFESTNYADTLITNLPFGNQYEINPQFAQQFFEKLAGIAQIKKIVILFPAVVDNPKWQLTRKFPVQILGFAAVIGVYQRRTKGSATEVFHHKRS